MRRARLRVHVLSRPTAGATVVANNGRENAELSGGGGGEAEVVGEVLGEGLEC